MEENSDESPLQQEVMSCPKCGKIYQDKEITYCYYDGTKLIAREAPTAVESQHIPLPRKNIFDNVGFEINLKPDSSPIANIPLELIESTTRFLQPNAKLPASAENVRSSLFSVPSPKPKRNFITKRLKHTGFSSVNLSSYIVCLLFIAITYTLWLTRGLNTYNINYLNNSQEILLSGLFINVLILILMILPIMILGYVLTDVIQAQKEDFQLRIEPALFIFSLSLNAIIYFLNWPLPIIVIPGEPKIRGVPPFTLVAKAIKNGILPGFFIILGFFGLYLLILEQIITIDNIIKLNIEIFLLFSLSMFFLALMPFKNALGKLIQKESPFTFYFIFTTVFFLLITLLTMIRF